MNEIPKRTDEPALSNGHGHKVRNRAAGNGVLREETSSLGQTQELVSLILGLTRHLLAVDDSAADLPLRQLRVCMLLHESPRSMSWLSRELSVSLSAMTQIADRLERARLVKRQFEGGDRRVRCLQLTGRGLKIMQAREEARLQRAKMVFDRMSESARGAILQAFNTLLGGCREVASTGSQSSAGETPPEKRSILSITQSR